MTRKAAPEVGSAAWKAFVVKAVRKSPAKRTEAEREAVAHAMKLVSN